MAEAFDKLTTIHPQATYTTARMGLFGIFSEKLDNTLKPGEAKPVWHSFVAGFSAGAMGALVGNPADLTLIRMQVRARVGPRKRLAADFYLRATREPSSQLCPTIVPAEYYLHRFVDLYSLLATMQHADRKARRGENRA